MDRRADRHLKHLLIEPVHFLHELDEKAEHFSARPSFDYCVFVGVAGAAGAASVVASTGGALVAGASGLFISKKPTKTITIKAAIAISRFLFKAASKVG